MKNIGKYSKHIVKYILASLLGLAIGCLAASPFYKAIIEMESPYPIRLLGFLVAFVAIFTIGIIDMRKKISNIADIKNHLGQIIESGMFPSIFTVIASGIGLIYLIIIGSQPISTTDYLLVITGIPGFLAEGWFFANLLLIPLIIQDSIIKPLISS